MTDIETAIMIKNMAREAVKQMSAKNAALREVAVTYSDGTTITTSMAAHLSDAEIKNYFRVGKEFNIGSGSRDKMVTVKSVKILNATVKNGLMTKMMEDEIKALKQTPHYQKHLTEPERKVYIDEYIKRAERARADALKNPSSVLKFLGRQNWMTDEDARKFLK